MIHEKKRYNQSLWHCMFHDYDVMKPILLREQQASTLNRRQHQNGQSNQGCSENTAVITENQARESNTHTCT